MVRLALLAIEILAIVLPRQVAGGEALHVPRPVANGEEQAVAEEIVIISALLVAAHEVRFQQQFDTLSPRHSPVGEGGFPTVRPTKASVPDVLLTESLHSIFQRPLTFGAVKPLSVVGRGPLV